MGAGSGCLVCCIKIPAVCLVLPSDGVSGVQHWNKGRKELIPGWRCNTILWWFFIANSLSLEWWEWWSCLRLSSCLLKMPLTCDRMSSVLMLGNDFFLYALITVLVRELAVWSPDPASLGVNGKPPVTVNIAGLLFDCSWQVEWIQGVAHCHIQCDIFLLSLY